MSDQRDGGISWTDQTWNPVRGCSRVSAGCDNCYAMSVAYRFKGPGQPYEGLATLRKGKPDWVGTTAEVPSHLSDPLRWKRPRRVFVNSMSDLFHPSISNEYIAAVFGVMVAAPRHTFQVLTKRPKRAAEWFAWLKAAGHRDTVNEALRAYVPGCSGSAVFPTQRHGMAPDPGWPLPNVWLGVSTEDQKAADERIPLLLGLPAAVRFISAEPLLGPLNLHPWVCEYGSVDRPEQRFSSCCEPSGKLAWVIVGGESGNGARPFDLGWARDLVNQCAAAGVSCFVKQMGADPIDGLAGCSVPFASKKGDDMTEWPTELRVREFPAVANA